MRSRLLAAALSLGLLAGCATSRPAAPRAQLVESRSALRAAEALGAEQLPEASRHLALARQQVKEAEQLLAQGQPEASELLLRQATADAELALALARAAPVQAELRQLRERTQSLRQEQP